MKIARSLCFLLVLGIVLAPVFMSLKGVPTSEARQDHFGDSPRFLSLLANSLLLVCGTVFTSSIIGIPLAFLISRTDLPGRNALGCICFVLLFIPLPLAASAWQSLLGGSGWLPSAWWMTGVIGTRGTTATEGIQMQPWAKGLANAVVIHASAAIPWVVLLAGWSLRCVERPLEEEASLATRPTRVFRLVTWPRAKLLITACLLWISICPLTEITVTDMMQVRTFSEESYTQIVVGDDSAISRAALLCTPIAILVSIVVAWLLWRVQRTLPALDSWDVEPMRFRLGAWKWFICAITMATILFVWLVPLSSLIWKLGYSPQTASWSATAARTCLAHAWSVRGWLLFFSVMQAAFAGCIATVCAFLLCWMSIGRPKLQGVLFLGLGLLWAWPSPLLGLGLKQAMVWVMALGKSDMLDRVLYYGPSPVPTIWAAALRSLPFVAVWLWPQVRSMPGQLLESGTLDGLNSWSELRLLYWPLLRPALIVASGFGAVLALGEVGAGKLVETPGGQTFAHEIFTLMHYGVTNDLAALCTMLLLVVSPLCIVLWFYSRSSSKGN